MDGDGVLEEEDEDVDTEIEAERLAAVGVHTVLLSSSEGNEEAREDGDLLFSRNSEEEDMASSSVAAHLYVRRGRRGHDERAAHARPGREEAVENVKMS
eukprot:evm.model.NODE_48581_length_41596_cov_62.772526.4